ncbi:hypothetical protein CYY_000271 [Polysphondylium violaceum]|uniref:Uncharacterized protein n=1 Tax=Polysphondylium violaceum TaxID=133409 RepID=A0A8J4VBP4_9MYCE|nr:hypothetical protein CYY_000271 [Polysphondylium violaceum]
MSGTLNTTGIYNSNSSVNDGSTPKRRAPEVTMCDEVRKASLRCGESFSKHDCKLIFDAATKCRTLKTKLDEEEVTIKKYLRENVTDQQKVTLETRLNEIRQQKSKQYPVPVEY